MSGKSTAKPVIGILGGVGAGKSTVAAELAALGCTLVDGDAIGHELLAEPAVREQLRQRWGGGIFTAAGEVDREALGKIVFNDPVELTALNSIMHPLIGRRIEQQIARAQADESVAAVVMDAAVMLEAGWDEFCTHLVFVDAPQSERLSRKEGAMGLEKTSWKKCEEFQIPLDKKAGICDYIIDNSSSVSCLRDQVRELFRKIVHTADRP
ncbi:MAG: dephospho-CoA kinase [Phycisphaerae bacterium]|nr:dephospho-CoA kinase [Phycisphaerae bacterium]